MPDTPRKRGRPKGEPKQKKPSRMGRPSAWPRLLQPTVKMHQRVPALLDEYLRDPDFRYELSKFLLDFRRRKYDNNKVESRTGCPLAPLDETQVED